MHTSYAADTNDDLIDEVAASSAQGEIKLRVQPTVYRGGNYVAWPGVSWTVVCEGAEECFAVRDALKECFAAMQRVGPAAVVQLLRAAEA